MTMQRRVSPGKCGDCRHYLPSEQAVQRAWLAGYGYCKAAPDIDKRARFFATTKLCWLTPAKFEALQ